MRWTDQRRFCHRWKFERWSQIAGGSINPDTNIVLHRHFNSGIHFISNPISWLHPIQWWSKSSQEVAVAVCNPTVFGNDWMLNMFDIYCMVLVLPTTTEAAETISAQNSRNLSSGAECRCPSSINEKRSFSWVTKYSTAAGCLCASI